MFAPSLIVGGGIGGAYAVACQHFFPHLVSNPAFYALVAMAAVFGGIARAPFTSIVFLFELSHNPNSLLPLIVCVMISDGFVRFFSRDSIMTGKLVKRGLIVLQDYSVPVLMRARIDDVMRKQFSVIQADVEFRTILQKFAPENMELLPVVEKDGTLLGIVEPHDLLKVDTQDHHFTMRELARQDYVRAYPGELVDRVNREMLLKNVENVVVVESHAKSEASGHRSRKRHSAIAPLADGRRKPRTKSIAVRYMPHKLDAFRNGERSAQALIDGGSRPSSLGTLLSMQQSIKTISQPMRGEA